MIARLPLRPAPGARRGTASLVWVGMLTAGLLAAGIGEWVTVSAQRHELDGIQRHRLVGAAAASALEEASARLERAFPVVPYPTVGRPREVGIEALDLPHTVTLETVPRLFANDGVRFEPVQVRWAPCHRKERRAAGAVVLERELTIVELAVRVHLDRGGRPIARCFRARRYATLCPARGADGVALAIEPRSFAQQEESL